MKKVYRQKNPRLSIRLLVILPIGVALLLFIAIFTYIFYSGTMNIVLENERENIRQQSDTITGIIAASTANIPAVTRDWASWDETYTFALGENPSFIDDKLESYEPLLQYKYNFVIIKDLSGNDLYTRFYDYNKMENQPVLKGFTDFLSPLTDKMLKNYQSELSSGYNEKIGKDGFVIYNRTAYYVSSLPILTSDEDAPPVGSFSFGRIFDDGEIKRITNASEMDFTILDALSPDVEGISIDISDSGTVIYKALPSFDENNNTILKIENPRDFYKDGIEDIKVTASILVVLMLLFMVVLFYLLEHNILRPLGQLSSDIELVTDDSSSIDSGRYSGSRELFTLSTSINDMLIKLAQSRLNSEQSEASVNVLKNVLNGIDAYLYVSDPNTDEILFINDSMREHFALGDHAVGEICWKVLQSGFDQRCDFCPNNKMMINPDVPVIWEEQNTVTGHTYNNTDRIIEWYDGKKVHMQHSVDITDIKQTQDILTRRLQQEELMSAISQSFITDDDMDMFINKALQMTGEFMNVSRIMLAHYLETEGELEFKYAWCVNDSLSNIDLNRRIPFAKGSPLYDSLVIHNSPIIAVNDVESNNTFRRTKPKGVKAFLMIPVFVSGAFWGTLGFEQCEHTYIWSESDMHLGKLIRNVLSGVINRQIMEEDKKVAEENILRAKEMAEQASKAKSEFLSRMSHEMRTPMNAIIGMTNIAKNTKDMEKKQHCLDRIDTASKHLLEVINDILDMSKIEANKFELYTQEFNFEKMLIDITNVISFRTEEKKQNLIVNLKKDVPLSLFGDELRLTQVITNLLTNAVKFTPEGGTVILSVEKESESCGITTLQIEVADNGIGISAEQQSRLFTSFEQADGGISRKFGGTGLGLAISKRIVELMGGRIWIESELGRGSKFIFTVNVKEGETKQHKLYTGIDKDKIRILAVDDSAETRDYFLHVCEALELPCDVAADGYEALHLINSCGDKPYNIFFVDWQMPHMNGIELTKKIKEFMKDKAVIIMVSVAEWNDIEKDATAAGVNRFIPKPLFPSTLVDSINACLGAGDQVDIGAQKSNVQGRFDFKNHCLLLAEDVDVNREILENILEDTGVTIDFAENGSEAVELFKEHPGRYSLILMDIQMPEMDGYEAAAKIRSLDYAEAKNIPIVAMTANVFQEDVENCLSAGMNDHIGKPVNPKDLFFKLNLYLKPKADNHKNGKTPKLVKSDNRKFLKVSDDYAEFMPAIDVLNALNRLMNNKKLYLTLLRNFTNKQIADELVKNINDADFAKTAQAAHALKGVSANLGLVNLLSVLSNIEDQAKAGIDSGQMVAALNDAVDEAITAINVLLGREGM